MEPKKDKKEKPSMCRQCGRSSVAGSKCAFEDQEKMAHCNTFIRIKPKKVKEVK